MRTVYCRKFKDTLPGLARPPFPGPKGEDIYQHLSQKAWDEWQKQQTMLINERRLNLAQAEDRRFLQAEMDRFFSDDEYTGVEGYVAPGSESH